MAKKSCEFGSEVSNGSKAGIVTFIFGMGAAIAKRLGKTRRRPPAKKKKE